MPALPLVTPFAPQAALTLALARDSGALPTGHGSARHACGRLLGHSSSGHALSRPFLNASAPPRVVVRGSPPHACSWPLQQRFRSPPSVTLPLPGRSGLASAPSRLPPPPPVMPPHAPFRNTSAPPSVVTLRRHCRDSDVHRIHRKPSNFGGGDGRRGRWSRWWEDSRGVIGGGDGGGGSAHRNRCLRVKAEFAGSVKFPANIAFAARAAIPVALLWLWLDWLEWRWCWWRLMGGFGRSCDRGNGGDGSSGSSSRLLRLLYLPCSHLHVSRNGAWWWGRWWWTR